MTDKYNEQHKTRIDKWLWAVRIFKTRNLAAIACNSGKIKIKGESVKSSKNIAVSDIITVQKEYTKYIYKVLNIIEKRVSAKLVSNYYENLTSEDELLKKHEIMKSAFYRPKGQGRPTKKERREIDSIRNNTD